MADVALPDGVGLVWASRFLAKNQQQGSNDTLASTIPGLDFMEDLVSISANRHVPIALIGGAPGVAVKAIECLRQKHTNLLGVAIDAPQFSVGPSGLAMNGSIDKYFETLAQDLKSQKIGMVFVALGAPKQEFFAEKLVHSLELIVHSKSSKTINHQPSTINPLIIMSVGGSFDEISGRIPRAPGWVSRMGVKWMWRLILEPWRIIRQLSLIEFIRLVVVERLGLK
jgi:N-acetylglucosaminyldiphosphoundecaprenol N-acetyl-beta-D-mannosaminyltransferase